MEYTRAVLKALLKRAEAGSLLSTDAKEKVRAKLMDELPELAESNLGEAYEFEETEISDLLVRIAEGEALTDGEAARLADLCGIVETAQSIRTP